MKNVFLKVKNTDTALTGVFCLILCVAICNGAAGASIEAITDYEVKSYAEEELALGAPALNVVSRLIYREAVEAIDRGDFDEAREKLLLARDLSSDFAMPSLTLAYVDLRGGDPDLILNLFDAVKRQYASFYKMSLAVINVEALFISGALMTLLTYLLLLMIKYGPRLNHKIVELYSKKTGREASKNIGLALIAALALLRPGFAVYAFLLIIAAWWFATRKEKAALAILVIFLSSASLFEDATDALVPAVDEGSVTRRLSLIDEEPARFELLAMIEEIDDERFESEKSFALGTIHFRRGNLIAATEYLKHSISLKKDFPPSFINLGNVYFALGDYDKALTGYRNAAALDSTNAVALYNIGQTCIKKMRFGLASSALKKAAKYGIEEYKERYPYNMIMNPEVITCGFRKSDLYGVAKTESSASKPRILDQLLRPWLLVPFGWIWIMLPLAVIIGAFTGRSLPENWKISLCDNCDAPVCPECVGDATGISLCGECSRIVNGLSSVKVIEALLRHKRQKSGKRAVGRGQFGVYLIPGGTHIFINKTFKGIAILALASAAILISAWKGLYLKDPRYFLITMSVWRTIIPLVIAAVLLAVSLRTKVPGRAKSFNILPQQMHLEEREEKMNGPAEPAASYQRNAGNEEVKDRYSFEEFLSNL